MENSNNNNTGVKKDIFSQANLVSVTLLISEELIAKKPYIDTCLTLLVTNITPKDVEEIKNHLLEFYEEQQSVTIVFDGGDQHLPLKDIGGISYPMCSFLVAGNDSLNKKRYSFGDLCRIISRLSAPDGCPWDRVQTHQSIRENMLEEAGEAVAAIDSGDLKNLVEELGDVMLQSIFHSDIAKRGGEFTLGDVITTLCNKLYTRHTHVFGDDKAKTEEDALKFWQKAKEKSKENL